MLIIKSNKAQYEYDIHSLIKAFYPEEEVRVLTPDSVIKDRTLLERPAQMSLVFEDEKVVFPSSSIAIGIFVGRIPVRLPQGSEHPVSFCREV